MFSIHILRLLLVASLSSDVTVTRSLRHNSPIPPSVTRLTDRFSHLPFEKAFSEFFGGPNVQRSSNGSCINLKLDNSSGSGFKSRSMYCYGFFSAAIKLPADYSAGVVVAFYMSNADVYPHNHDEIDFELLGHEKGKEWVLQTNVYGNGSVGTGREEKFYMWFDPTADFHEYSILWNNHHIVFLVDNIPVREMNPSVAMSRAYPWKPMSVYATIWDGSKWATHGGKKPVNYKSAPFVASLKDFEMEGRAWNQTKLAPFCSNNGQNSRLISLDPVEGQEFIKLSEQQKVEMEWARNGFMFYSYCNDPNRFPVTPPECREGK